MSLEQDIDTLRDVYMTRAQREAYERLLAQIEMLISANNGIAHERNALRGFVADILDDWPDCSSLDGGDIQSLAVKHGLLAGTVVHVPCNGGDPDKPCHCEEYCTPDEFHLGVTCYRRTDLVKGGVE